MWLEDQFMNLVFIFSCLISHGQTFYAIISQYYPRENKYRKQDVNNSDTGFLDSQMYEQHSNC